MEITYKLCAWLKESNIISTVPIFPTESIKLSLEESEKLELGLILPLIKPYFTDSLPLESDFKLKNTPGSRLYNWNMLIAPLEALGISLNSDTKALIVSGDRTQICHLLIQLQHSTEKLKGRKLQKATVDGSLFLNNIKTGSKFTETESLLEFFVLSFCRAFKISPKLAAGLLANNGQLLAQILIKGLKRNFTPVFAWYNIIIDNEDHVISLIDGDSASIKTVFNCLVPGILCKVGEVVEITMKTLVILQSKLKNPGNACWDWFCEESASMEMCFALIRTSPELSEGITNLIYCFSKRNTREIFVVKLREYSNSTYDYLNTVKSFLKSIKQLNLSDQFYNCGIIEEWIEICFKEAETEAKNSNSRALCTCLLCDIWCGFSNSLQFQEETSNKILSLIKKSISEGPRNFQLLLLGRLFNILSKFSAKKITYAPILYKTLAFCIVENYTDDCIREFMLLNMMQIFEEIPTIPINIVIEPLFLKSHEQSDLNLGVFDFDFYIAVCRHQRFTVKEAVLLLDLCGKVLLSDSLYYKAAEFPFLITASRFINSNPIQEYLLKFVSLTFKLRYLDTEKSGINFRKNFGITLVEKIVRLKNCELNQEIWGIFTEFAFETRRYKDRKVELVWGLLGESLRVNENTPAKSVSPRTELFIVNSFKSMPSIRAVADIERIKQKKLEREGKELQEIRQKTFRELLQKKFLRKEITKRRIELGVRSKSKQNEDDSTFFSENVGGRKDKECRVQYLRIKDESKEDRALIQLVLKRYKRVNRALFSRYSYSAYHIKTSQTPTFDKIKSKKNSISEADFSKMLKDLRIIQALLSIEEFRSIYSYLSTKLKTQEIQCEAFQELLYMIAATIFTREPYDCYNLPPAIHMQMLYDYISKAKDLPIPRFYFFESDPGKGNRDVVNGLNKKLEQNPEYPIPENYKKYQETILTVEYKSISGSASQNLVIELLDEILFKAIGIHFLMPGLLQEQLTRVKGIPGLIESRSASYNNLPKIECNPGFSKLSPNIKIHAVAAQNLSEDLAIDCAQLIDDLIYSVEKNSFLLISKLPRPVGTVSNRCIQERVIREMEQVNQSERAERQRKERMKKANEKTEQFKLRKEYQDYLESEEKKKKVIKAKFTEKKIKAKKERLRFQMEEKILEYKIKKIESGLNGRIIVPPKKDIWRAGKYEKSMSTSADLSCPIFIEQSSARHSRFKAQGSSVPRFSTRSQRQII